MGREGRAEGGRREGEQKELVMEEERGGGGVDNSTDLVHRLARGLGGGRGGPCGRKGGLTFRGVPSPGRAR